MDITAWIQALTQVIVAATAVIMAVLAYKTYLRAPEQEEEPESAEDRSFDEQQLLKELVVFRTLKQTTRLRVTDGGLECHLDDIRPGRGGRQWTLSKGQVAEILRDGRISVNPGYRAATGVFRIGHRTNWLYSKKLFPESEYLLSSLRELLKNVNG